MYLNHTIDDTLGAYRGMYKMEVILIFHSEYKNTHQCESKNTLHYKSKNTLHYKSKNPPHWISNKEDFHVYKGVWRDVCLIM